MTSCRRGEDSMDPYWWHDKCTEDVRHNQNLRTIDLCTKYIARKTYLQAFHFLDELGGCVR
jgi:hypothetical protein